MEHCDYPDDVKKFIFELLKRNVISKESLYDKTFINYLFSQRYDVDFIKALKHKKQE
jgi:hypothetical protein